MYENKDMTIYNDDNMVLMQMTPDNHYDIAIVDPPYGIGKDWKKDKRNVMKDHISSYANDKVPNDAYFKELFRISKNQIVWGANYYAHQFPQTNSWIVWNKKVDYPTQHHSEGELAWHSFKIPLRIVDLWWNGAVKCEEVTKIHPHQKPVRLYEWVLKNYSKPGDKIIDTHLGSGSLAIAVHNMNAIEKMNLHLTACEIDTDYFIGSVDRIKEHISHQTIFNYEVCKTI